MMPRRFVEEEKNFLMHFPYFCFALLVGFIIQQHAEFESLGFEET